MSEFKKVQFAELSPTKCVTCGDHIGPFVDLEVELPVYGHLYLCISTEARPGCVRQIARHDGMVSADEYRTLQLENMELNTDVDELVERLRSDKVVSLAEAMDYVNR